ncbi:MAG: polysaccharide deacetylase family protein [Magnetococcales bacterium]|nr:polysaccharide deacetylase family protein [Magnetococcales bacterium]
MMKLRKIYILVVLVVLVFGWSNHRVQAGESLENRQLFLTFDDGPLSGTREILALLTREEVPGTFFLVGDHVVANDERRETLRMLKESPWVRIANHSYSHAWERYRSFYADPEGLLADFRKNNEILGFVQPPYPIRLPGRIDWRFEERHVSAESYPRDSEKKGSRGVEQLFENGFVIYGWDLEWGRPGRRNPLEPVESLLNRIRQRLVSGHTVKPDRIVILMHDFHFNTKSAFEALESLIRGLKREKLAFKWIQDY